MVVKVVQLVVVDRNAQMVLVPELDLVVGHGTVDPHTQDLVVDVMVMLMVLAVADLVGVVCRRNRPNPHRSPQAVDQRA